VTIALVRVDDRLIHGQVVVGWGRAIRADGIALVDDDIAATEWEQDLYRMGVPAGVKVEFISVADAEAAYSRWTDERKRIIIIVGDVGTLRRLCDEADIPQVNLGGIHAAPGRTERLPYVFLSDEETEVLQRLAARGVEITAQDVPHARRVALRDLI
jgi:mannose/fructose/N-acetylgalactosamine-specific phosphotransferase system component IIB